MTPRGATRLKIWLVLLGVFALGCVTGGFLDSAYRLNAFGGERGGRGGGRDREERMFEGMKRDLNLTEQQATEIRAVLEETRNGFRSLRSEVRPRYDALRQNSRARIRALLTPEQQQRFDAKTAEMDARRDRDDKDGRKDERDGRK
jgi:Spy/CpxP family protein refolding chaperone